MTVLRVVQAGEVVRRHAGQARPPRDGRGDRRRGREQSGAGVIGARSAEADHDPPCAQVQSGPDELADAERRRAGRVALGLGPAGATCRLRGLEVGRGPAMSTVAGTGRPIGSETTTPCTCPSRLAERTSTKPGPPSESGTTSPCRAARCRPTVRHRCAGLPGGQGAGEAVRGDEHVHARHPLTMERAGSALTGNRERAPARRSGSRRAESPNSCHA